MLRNKKGQVTAEYIIIISVIVVVLIPLLLIMGKAIKEEFTKYNVGYDQVAEDVSVPQVLNPEVNYPEPIVASFQDPIVDCLDNLCSIDFGDITLTNLPQDFTEIVETSGISGANEVLSDLLAQISDQVASEEQTETIKDMANIGFYIASINEQLETIALECTAEADAKKCMDEYFKSDENLISLPENIQDVIVGYEVPENNWEQILQAVIMSGNYDTSKGINDSVGDTFTSIFDEISNDKKLSKDVKSIVTDIYGNIYDLNYDTLVSVLSVKDTMKRGEKGQESIVYIDPITGKKGVITILKTDKKDKKDKKDSFISKIASSITSTKTTDGSKKTCETGEWISLDEECL